MRPIFLLLLSSVLFLSACTSVVPSFKPYKLDVQQGNVITSKMMSQVKPGMTKSQIKFILGTPLIQDSFHKDRWDYFYQYRKAGQLTDQHRVILEFKDDLLVNIAGDPIPEGTLDPASMPKSDMLDNDAKKTLVDTLKFWKDDEKPAIAATKTEQKKSPWWKFWGSDETPKEEVKAAAEVVNKSSPEKSEAPAVVEEPKSVLALPEAEVASNTLQEKAAATPEPAPETAPQIQPEVPPTVTPAVADTASVTPASPSEPVVPVVERDIMPSDFRLTLDKVLTPIKADSKSFVAMADEPPQLALSRGLSASVSRDGIPKLSSPPEKPVEPSFLENLLEKIGF